MKIQNLSDLELARIVAKKAGDILLALRKVEGLDAKKLGDFGDAFANNYIIQTLRQLRPADAILSEEEKDDKSRLGKTRVWIIDPLDGTREFSDGRDDWAVHIALAINGVATLGVVALPALNKIYTSEDARKLKPLQHKPKILISRTRPPPLSTEIAQALGGELVPMGSAGAKAMAVLAGQADVYYHSGGQSEWDNCAPVAVCQAHGLHCSRIDGSELRYNQSDTLVPDLLICHREFAGKIIELLS